MTTDDQIILRLMRENARLISDNDALNLELTKISVALDDLGLTNSGYDPVDRIRALVSLIRGFPIRLDEFEHKLPGFLFKVTTPTSIENVEDYVVAQNRETVQQWVNRKGYAKGYEPTIEQCACFIEHVYWLSTTTSS